MDTTVAYSRAHSASIHPDVSVVSAGQRVLLWVDAVGGYLVCLSEEVTIGQAVADSPAEIALVGDLSRQHARIRRENETYVLTALAATRIDGRPVSSRVPLGDGDELELGSSVVLRFRQPHPLSTTARLEIISHHRPDPSADGIILMSSSCILGPSSSAHIVCRHWPQEVILFRGSPAGELRCRSEAGVEVDGVWHAGKASLTHQSHVRGEGLSFSLEPAP